MIFHNGKVRHRGFRGAAPSLPHCLIVKLSMGFAPLNPFDHRSLPSPLAGLDPAIHVFDGAAPEDVDAPPKPGQGEIFEVKSSFVAAPDRHWGSTLDAFLH